MKICENKKMEYGKVEKIFFLSNNEIFIQLYLIKDYKNFVILLNVHYSKYI